MDFTFSHYNKVVVRFNDANVVELIVDTANLTITGKLYDEVSDKEYNISGSIVEVQ